MGLSRGGGGNRFSAAIWPGFVDAMTALLMVMMFVLTIFLLVQSVLRDQITTQDSELDQLGQQLAQLRDALSSSQSQAEGLDRDLGATRGQLTQAQGRIDEQTEAARLAAARRDALEALVADLRRRNLDAAQALTQTQTARAADAEAAKALQDKLAQSDTELTAMAMELEAARKQAEDTLTLLAAAEAAKRDLTTQAGGAASEAERQAALLAVAQEKLAGEQKSSDEAQRRVALLNQQVATLNQQLSAIQQALNATETDKQAAEVRLEDLGGQLNAALLNASQEQQRRLTLEEAERKRLQAEAADLARYRSEFFGRLSEVLQGREGVQVVGDRFVFQSEVLFDMGDTTLSDAGRTSIARVTAMLQDIAKTIPPEIDWVIRVDGHTDSTPLSGTGRYRDNWELSQARALAVVRYMVDELGFPADRLAPTGFAETRPLVPEDTPENRAKNRRIELKLTER